MISIIIPSHNGRKLLQDCLNSLMKLRKIEYEVIVVDNGSTDGTRQFLEETFPSVHVIETDHALGFSKAVNIGIQQSRGDAIALLNNDTEVEPEWLYELNEALREHPDVGICASKILQAQAPHLIYSAGDGFTVAGFGYRRGSEEPEAISCLQREYVFSACAGAALYRREVFDKVGLLDEDFYAFIEDLDIGFRAQLMGYRCLYVPTARVYHIGGATFGDRDQRALYYGYRNRISFIAKCIPTRIILRHLHSILGHSLLSILIYTLKGHGTTLINAHWDGMKTLPLFLKKRKKIQATQTVSTENLDKILDKHWFRIMLRFSRFFRRFYEPLPHAKETTTLRSSAMQTE